MDNKYNKYLSTLLLTPNPNIYLSDNYLVLDFETSNTDYGDPTNPDNYLINVCYKGSSSECVVDWSSEFEQKALLSSISKADFIVAHNSKFELGWLKRCGLDLTEQLCWCTQIAEYTLSGGIRRPLSLDACLNRRRLPRKHFLGKTLVHGGVHPENVPRSILEAYVKGDVITTELLFLKQREEIFEKGLEKVLYTRNLFTPCLADIEFNGMQLDKDLVMEAFNRDTEELERVERELFEITGGINPRSNKQLAEFIFDTLGFAEPKDWAGNPIRTAKGERSVGSEVIGKLQARNKRQRDFLGLKKHQSALQGRLSKYLRKFKDCCDNNEGVLKFNFNQTITATGRLSSNGKQYKVQGQNIKRDLKKLFRTRIPGGLIQERDHKGLEFRESGELTKDPQVIYDIVNGVDIHSFTAKVLSESGQPTERQAAKSHTFKPLYGGVTGTEAEQAYYQAFKEKYNVLTKCQDRWVDEALRTGKYVSPTGNIFYFPDLRVTRNGYIVGNTAVRDYPIQYFATGEIVPIGVTIFWRLLNTLGLRSFLVNTIHDSIVNELFVEEKELVDDVAVQSLTTLTAEYIRKLYGIELEVPLEVDLKEGQYWN